VWWYWTATSLSDERVSGEWKEMKKRGSGCVVRSERRVAHQHISITHNLSDLEAGIHRISVHGSINGHILSVSLQETLFGLGVPSLISVSAANLYARIRNCCILPPMLQLCVLTAAARAMAHILLCDTQSAFGLRPSSHWV
jgi:hypothetical protein